MNNNHFSITSLLLLLSIYFASATACVQYLGEHSRGKTIQDIEDIDHHSSLQHVKGSKEEAKASIIYSYIDVINGFSALLTPQDAAAISGEMDGVISVFESQERRVHTTRSWDFISLLEANFDPTQANGEALLRRANYGKDVIVGVPDTGN
ncbi:Cucumisin [Handroanthus impetiginosus]|uniref:Cucumisin n=1 Tax=Handroanthus impetiginosus TaxID=429701 RepID=A0A2G9HZ13_9LAMI|nr:Cucumisin [Handroanthus impetiginosus]